MLKADYMIDGIPTDERLSQKGRRLTRITDEPS